MGDKRDPDRGVEVEYGEGQGHHKGANGSKVMVPCVGDFPGDGAVQLGLTDGCSWTEGERVRVFLVQRTAQAKARRLLDEVQVGLWPGMRLESWQG